MSLPRNLHVYQVPPSPQPTKTTFVTMDTFGIKPNLIGDLLPYGTARQPRISAQKKRTRPKSAPIPSKEATEADHCVTFKLQAPKSSFLVGSPIFDMSSLELPPPPCTNISAMDAGKSAVCRMCGQSHSPEVNHVYDYQKMVDEDLMCHICLQPLVDPVDTKCGHTLCSLCLHNYLKIQSMCPVDRIPVIAAQVQQSSVIVRRLLDKLLVVCPNVDYCEEVLPRSDLEAHLANRCKGALTKISRPEPHFQGQMTCRTEWEDPQHDFQSLPSKKPIVEGEVTTVDIQRGCYDLGISVVGGLDTPLLCVVIQEVFPEGVVAKDGRLLPGDQILEVNGIDLGTATHSEAKRGLSQVYPICRLTVYRERAEETPSSSADKQDVLKVSLPRIPGKQLGIKLVSKKNTPGLYILDVIPGGIAHQDDRLRTDDLILEINSQDIRHSSQEDAARIIQASTSTVDFLVLRRDVRSPDTRLARSQEILRMRKGPLLNADGTPANPIQPCKEKHISVNKEAFESLGISVVGGLGHPRGDIPIYVTNLQTAGCLGRTKLIQKGDVLVSINGHSLLELTHAQAVRILKMAAEDKSVALKVLEGPESSDGIANFTPSWKFWLSMPIVCHSVKTIQLDRGSHRSLGFSVVGGRDSCQGAVPIYVKSVVPNAPAGKDGRLRSGDQLLSVQGDSLENIDHSQAVSLLRNVQGSVTLRVVSWPGTPV